MSSIYELTGDYMRLCEIADDPECSDFEEDIIKMFLDTEERFEKKCENYAKLIKNIAGEQMALKGEEDRLREKRKTLENREKFLKKTIEKNMLVLDKKKFKTTLFSFNIQKNPPSCEIINPKDIPEEYVVPQEVVFDKRGIIEKLKAGEEVSGAILTRSESLRIR
jgi:superfamily II RNA helicase